MRSLHDQFTLAMECNKTAHQRHKAIVIEGSDFAKGLKSSGLGTKIPRDGVRVSGWSH